MLGWYLIHTDIDKSSHLTPDSILYINPRSEFVHGILKNLIEVCTCRRRKQSAHWVGPWEHGWAECARLWSCLPHPNPPEENKASCLSKSKGTDNAIAIQHSWMRWECADLDAVVDLAVVEESGPGGGAGEHEARPRVHEDGELPFLVTLIKPIPYHSQQNPNALGT